MDKSFSSDEDQEHLIKTVNKLTGRLVEMEEFIKGHSSKADANVVRLSNKVDKILAALSSEKESLISVPGYFTHSYLRDMMTSLTLPGMKFIGEKCLHSYLWIFIHLIFLLISYVYIKEEYDNWQSSPVIKSSSNNLTYVNEIPFPAITVCLPGSIRNGYKFFDEISKCISCNEFQKDCTFNKKCNYIDIASLAVASLICPYKFPRNYAFTDSILYTAPWEVFEKNMKPFTGSSEFSWLLYKVAPDCDIKIKQYRNVNYDLYSVPLRTMTSCYGNGYLTFLSSFGLCFTTNGLLHEDIFKENTVLSTEEKFRPQKLILDPDKMYKGKNFTLENMIYLNGSVETIPAYISEIHQIAYSIFGRTSEESVRDCRMNETDLKDAYFAIHNPVEVPFIFNSDFDLKIGNAKEIRIIPKLVITEKSLESYKPAERGCFYSYERELSMFKHYSESNCKTECIANCSLQYCGCVPYYLPRHNNSVNVCLRDCYEASKCNRKACGCLLDCYSLSYDFEIASAREIGNEGRKGTVYIHFKKSSFYPTFQVSLTSLAQFVAYCLGVVGVFNGFSVMVVFEIFYFLTFKLWDSVKSYFK